MALVLADRVNETTTTAGLGTLTLAGAVAGYQSFSVIGNANTTYYTIVGQTTGEWEVGIGTYTSAGTTLSRDTVLSSSAGGTTKVTLSAGTKFVFCDYPAGRAVYLDTASNATIPGITLSGGTANGVAYLNASKVLTTGSALTYNGTGLGIGVASASNPLHIDFDGTAARIVRGSAIGFIYNTGTTSTSSFRIQSNTGPVDIYTASGQPITFSAEAAEQMRLNSTGLGIGTSSPSYKLDVVGGQRINAVTGGYIDMAYNGTVVGNLVAASGLLYVNTQTTNTAINANGGNVGIGTSSPAYKLDVNGVANFAANVGHRVGAALFFAGTGTSSGLNYLYTNTTAMAWRNAADSSELMRLDNSGNLLVGGTSLVASEKVSVQTNANSAQYIWVRNSNAGASASSAIALNASGNTWGIECGSSAKNSNSLTFVLDYGGTNAEKMRLDTSGNLLVGTTSTGYTSSNSTYYTPTAAYWINNHATGTASGTRYVGFGIGVNEVGSITQNGTTGVLFNITSDYRLKEFVAPVTGAGERIDALNPVEFDWKSDGSRARGFFAHEFQQVYASSVNGTKDAVDEEGNPVYQTMQASTAEVIADLVAEIKSLRVRLNALENK